MVDLNQQEELRLNPSQQKINKTKSARHKLNVDLDVVNKNTPTTKHIVSSDGTVVIEELKLNETGLTKNAQPVLCKTLKDGSNLNLKDLKCIKNIGHGGEASVNLYHHEKSNSFVAVKEIRLNTNNDEEGEIRRKQIHSELTTYAEIVTRGITGFLDFYGVFYEEGFIKIALEFMDNGSIFDHQNPKVEKLSSNVLSEKELSKIARQVLLALLFLHEDLNAVHKDIKPQNILIDSQGKIVLADFGILEVYAKDRSIQQNLGTRPYMSPERLNPKAFNYSTKDLCSFTAGDIWGLGVSILEIALGHYPFSSIINSSVFDLFAYFEDHEVDMLNSICNEFSVDFRSFITLCLKRDPKERATARQLLEHPFLINHTR
jgi:serine/threonine protein kinase